MIVYSAFFLDLGPLGLFARQCTLVSQFFFTLVICTMASFSPDCVILLKHIKSYMLEDRHPIANLLKNPARESIPAGFLYLTFLLNH
jgi:hypothetical protein